MKQKTDKKSSPGRPLQGDKKRERVSFTLDPEQIRWLKQQESVRHQYKSQVLEKVIREAQVRWNKTSISSPIPSPKIYLPYEDIKKVCEKWKVEKLSLYGSVLTDVFTADSDIDILIEFLPQHTPTLFELVRIEKELEDIFDGRKVDVKTLQELSPYFRKNVLKDAFCIYEKE